MKKEDFLKSGEHIDDLERDGLSIIQRRGTFSFGVDSVLIANFTQVKKGMEVLDIGTGTGIIPILLSAKSKPFKITAIEIQEEMADMAMRSVKMNSLEHLIEVLNEDIRDYAHSNRSRFDLVVSNPPYFKAGSAMISDNDSKMISRHEIRLNIEELFQAASSLLKPRGKFYLIHRPDRMVDIFYHARVNNLEVKRAKMVYSRVGSEPKLLILECVKGGGSEIKWQKPLYIYDEDGNYTEEIYKIYENSKITSFDA